MIGLHHKTIHEALGREPVHPFPARMAPGIALAAIEKARKPLRVLDPMVGSGTVIALARLKKHKAIGVDIDPLAVLISKVWTTAVEAEDAKSKAREVSLCALRRSLRRCHRAGLTLLARIKRHADLWPIGLTDTLDDSLLRYRSR